MANVIPLNSVTLKLLYGGSFGRNEYGMVYSGIINRTVAVDVDEFCWFTIVEEAEKCGCYKRDVDAIFFMNPDVGLERVVDDKGAEIMCKLGVVERVVECYLVSAADIPHIMHLIEVSMRGGNATSLQKCSKKLTTRRKVEIKDSTSQKQGPLSRNIKKDNTPSHTTIKVPFSQTLKETPPKITQEESQTTTIVQRKPPRFSSKDILFDIPETTFETSLDFPKTTAETLFDFNDITINDAFSAFELESDLACLNDGVVLESEEEGDLKDPGYEPGAEEGLSDGEGTDDEELFENEVEENLLEKEILFDDNSDDEELQEARKKVKEWNVKALKTVHQRVLEAASSLLPGQESNVPGGENTGEKKGCESDYDKSGDEVDTSGESDDEPVPGKRKKSSIIVVNEHTDFSKLKWGVGIRFSTRDFFRECVTKYSVAQGRNCSFVVSDNSRGKRLGVRCKRGCPFKLYGSWDNNLSCFLTKSVNNTHTCQRTMEKNRQLKSTWVAKQYLEVFKATPHWPASEIIDNVRRAYKIIIKKGFAYKVKYYAHKLLHGSMKDHYSKIGSYLSVLEQEYPNSTFTLSTKPHRAGSEPVFHRLFVCFDSLKQGWLEGCRKVLAVDACFLKTFLGGQLISATGRDGNDQMYPLAWAVVEGENNESYQWFFQQLKAALGEEDGEGWTIISDEHQSIISMVAQEFPRAEHRRCARHIFANWHKSYKGEEMKMMFWNAAKAYNQSAFDEAISAMREVDPRAAEAFMRCNPVLFCRAFISTISINDVIVNNMAETFNAYIINARSKHVIYMLEDIRTTLMQRRATKKQEMEEWGGVICPKIQELLEKEKDKAAHCTAILSNTALYQVKDGIHEVKVNLVERTCTCRKWDVTGVPCHHAVAAIFDQHAVAEDYVHEAYRKVTYLRAYNNNIAPCPSERYWPKVTAQLIPPPIKVGPGRPRKKRRRDPHEDPKRSGKLTKHGLEMTCSVCKSKEHNKRRCPQKGSMLLEPTPKRGRGRPRNVNTPDSNRRPPSTNSEANNEATAQPTRLARNGRVIRNAGRGRGRGRARGGAREGSRERAPRGIGVLFDGQGNAFINNLSGPRGIDHPASHSSQPTTQVSSNEIQRT